MEGTNSADEGKAEEDLNYTFGNQEPIGELFQKVLDAIASYRQEKADQAYYQAYRARTAESTEEAAEDACQSFSPTLEAEKTLEGLIARAEKSASDRARIVKKVRAEASEVQETLEEVRWRFHELSQREKSTNEADKTQSHVTKTNKSRIRTESGGSYQEKECAEAGSAKRDSRKEEGKGRRKAPLERHSKERENRREKTEGTRALDVDESSNEEFPENRNRVTRGAELDGEPYKLGRPTHSGNTDSLETDQGRSNGARGPVNESNDVGGASYQRK